MAAVTMQLGTLISLLEGKVSAVGAYCRRLDERLTTLESKLDLLLAKLN